jgi:O-antigen/teichoic acid export membrane protein
LKKLIYIYIKNRKFEIYSVNNLIFKTIPELIRSTLIRNVGGNVFSVLATLLASIIQTHYLSLEQLGSFRYYGILTNYLVFLNLGIWFSFQRFNNIKDESVNKKELGDTAYSWYLSLTVFFCMLFLLLSIFSLINSDLIGFLGWSMQIPVIISAMFVGFVNSTYKSAEDFYITTKSSVISSITALVSLPLLMFGSIGFYLKSVITGSVSNFLIIKKQPYRYQFAFNLNSFLLLLKQGFPLFTASYLMNMGFMAVETTVISNRLDLNSIGIYSFVIMIFEVIKVVPNTFISNSLPTIYSSYKDNKSTKEILFSNSKVILLTITLCTLIAFTGLLISRTVLDVFFPNYLDTVPSLIVMLCFFIFYPLEFLTGIILAKGNLYVQNISAIFLLIFYIFISYLPMLDNKPIEFYIGLGFILRFMKYIIYSLFLIK